MPEPYATPPATRAFASRFPDHQRNGFFRDVQGLTVSTLGLGSYLGHRDDATDRSYAEAVIAAYDGGINVFDTSLNYRHQRSERAIGEAIRGIPRQEIVVCTKAGYLVPDALPVGALRAGDVVGGSHCMAPAFLEDQLARSRRNLGVDAVDVFYLHNPETQLQYVGADEFYRRVAAAFLKLEQIAASGLIRTYGCATWDGFRGNGQSLSLTRLAGIARDAGGPDHRFRFIQLPFNLAMTEAFGQRPEILEGRSASVLEAAEALGISVIASASLLQTRLVSGLPEQLATAMPGPANDAARALQFARSAPGIRVALVGMSRAAHVRENLAAVSYPPLDPERFSKLFGG